MTHDGFNALQKLIDRLERDEPTTHRGSTPTEETP